MKTFTLPVAVECVGIGVDAGVRNGGVSGGVAGFVGSGVGTGDKANVAVSRGVVPVFSPAVTGIGYGLVLGGLVSGVVVTGFETDGVTGVGVIGCVAVVVPGVDVVVVTGSNTPKFSSVADMAVPETIAVGGSVFRIVPGWIVATVVTGVVASVIGISVASVVSGVKTVALMIPPFVPVWIPDLDAD